MTTSTPAAATPLIRYLARLSTPAAQADDALMAAIQAYTLRLGDRYLDDAAPLSPEEAHRHEQTLRDAEARVRWAAERLRVEVEAITEEIDVRPQDEHEARRLEALREEMAAATVRVRGAEVTAALLIDHLMGFLVDTEVEAATARSAAPASAQAPVAPAAAVTPAP